MHGGRAAEPESFKNRHTPYTKKGYTMNVYDFDDTIYSGDSTRDFCFFCIRKYPRVLRHLPVQARHFLRFATGLCTKTQFKEKFYGFFRYVPDMDKAVSDFWDTHFARIKDWYMEEKKPDDVIISASPAFLLDLPLKKLGLLPPIASIVDPKTGAYTGENCYGEEKPPRFRALYPDAKIEAFFSDSLSDTPMALLAEKSYIVRENVRMPWSEYRPSFLSHMKKMFFSPTFVKFLLVGILNTALTTVFSVLYNHLIPYAVPAFAAGYITTLLLSFLLNCGFTFKKKPTPGRLFKYAVSYIPNFLVQCASVWLLCDLCHLPRLFSYAAAAIIGVPLTYVLMKIFTFKK